MLINLFSSLSFYKLYYSLAGDRFFSLTWQKIIPLAIFAISWALAARFGFSAVFARAEKSQAIRQTGKRACRILCPNKREAYYIQQIKFICVTTRQGRVGLRNEKIVLGTSIYVLTHVPAPFSSTFQAMFSCCYFSSSSVRRIHTLEL